MTQIPRIGSGPGSRSAMRAGVRKMPEPMTEPTTIAVAERSPTRRGSAVGAWEGAGGWGASLASMRGKMGDGEESGNGHPAPFARLGGKEHESRRASYVGHPKLLALGP